MDSIALLITLGSLFLFTLAIAYDSVTRIQELEEESLADKEIISHLTEELCRHKDWLLTIRDRLEIDF